MGRALGLVLAAALALPASAGAADLTVYSSLPLAGPLKGQAEDTLRAEQLALEQAGGRAGAHTIRLVSRNDATRRGWDPGRVAENARRATGDESAIAYLGEFNSGASAISMPILNEAGILQVSPFNGYVGLTRREAALPGEPSKYRPAGVRTYGRVNPADHVQAAAIAALLQAEGHRRVFLVDDREAYGAGLAAMVRRRVRARGIRVVGRRHLRTPQGRRNLISIARAIRRARPDAMVFGGIAENNAAGLWREVHRRNPRIALIGPEGVTDRAFYRHLGGAARRTLITNPTLEPAAYPPAAQAFSAAFRTRFSHEPQPYALYGYEAMSVVLDSIARAGTADRAAVVGAFFATRDRDSVLGRYSIDANGDTTLSTYGVLKVSRKRLVYDRTIDSAR
jgi:branched-chain amino acid transport system substrate-binding protein